MTDTESTKDRIPYEALDDDKTISAWRLPLLPNNAITRKNRRPKAKKETIETIKMQQPLEKMTAEKLQEISDSARRDGMQQGLKQGIEQGLREGRSTGEKEGKNIAYNEAKKDIVQLQNQLQSLTESLMEPMQDLQQEIENIVVDMAFNLAKRLVAKEIEQDPKGLLPIVKQVVESVGSACENTRLFLNENDAERVSSLIPENRRSWRIEIDEQLASGGCRVETDSSLVDFSIEHRLHQFFEKATTAQAEALKNAEALPDYQVSSNEELSMNTRLEDSTRVDTMSKTPEADEDGDASI